MAHREVIFCEVTLAYNGELEKTFIAEGSSVEAIKVDYGLGKSPKETIINIKEIHNHDN